MSQVWEFHDVVEYMENLLKSGQTPRDPATVYPDLNIIAEGAALEKSSESGQCEPYTQDISDEIIRGVVIGVIRTDYSKDVFAVPTSEVDLPVTVESSNGDIEKVLSATWRRGNEYYFKGATIGEFRIRKKSQNMRLILLAKNRMVDRIWECSSSPRVWIYLERDRSEPYIYTRPYTPGDFYFYPSSTPKIKRA